jgi:hypothetical protein
LRFALWAALLMLLGVPVPVDAQVVQGVQQGAREGNKAAGPVGGVLGGAIGGVVGVVTGVTGVFTGKNGQQAAPASEAKPANEAKKETKDSAKDGAKTAKTPKATKLEATKTEATKMAKQTPAPSQTPAVLTQEGTPALTAVQIVANSDANIDRIKTELNLTPEQEKNWSTFSSAMHYLGHNGADRLNLRIARAKRDPPDDIVEQMRNEAQFLNDRAVDQRAVADAAEPLYTSLDDKQKQLFIEEMVRLSHERGLD